MVKESRHQLILNEIEKHGIVTVKKLTEKLKVTDMTIRRDLIELEQQALLDRVHGGARRKVKDSLTEVSHNEKSMLHIEDKHVIAKKCAQLIQDNDTIFIGAGTTTYLISDYIENKTLNIVTNSLPIFEKVKEYPKCDVILIGGRYRMKTQTFVGQFANRLLEEIKVSKAFVGVNGIDIEKITTANEEEGHGNEIILNNAIKKYIVADSSKFDSYSFYSFYDLENIDAVITDDKISDKVKYSYSQRTEII